MPTLGLHVPSADWLLTEDDIRGAFAKRGAAREVLGKADGDVRLTVGQFHANYRAQADFIAKSLSELGLQTIVEEISTREYGDRVWVGGDYQLALRRTAADIEPYGKSIGRAPLARRVKHDPPRDTGTG